MVAIMLLEISLLPGFCVDTILWTVNQGDLAVGMRPVVA